MFDDEDLPLIKYESPFMKKFLVPQEPRLFCLIYNSLVVDYSDTEPNNQNLKEIRSSETSLYNFGSQSPNTPSQQED